MISQFFKILAIDNNPDNHVVLKSILAEAFPKVTLCSAVSGKEGIAVCHAQKTDVVLLNILLPEMDGYEVCNILKSSPDLQHIPVIMLMETSATAISRRKAMYSGADAFLTIPLDESDFTVQIRTMIRLKESEDLKSSEKERLEKEVKERTAALERELQERRKAEEALQNSLVRLEKGRSAELNLLEDLRNEITQRRDAVKALKESRQQLLDIIDFLPDATFVVDNEMKVIAWNKAMEDMTRVQKKDMIGKGDNAYAIPFYGKKQKQLLDFIDSDDKEIIARYSNVSRIGLSLNAEIFAPALYGGKGAHISVLGAPLFNSSGVRVGSIESIRDITERRLAEVALHDSEALLHTLVQTIPDLIWLKDTEGIYLSCNVMFGRFFGGSEAEIVGKTDYDFVDSDLADFFRENDRKAMAAGKSTSNEEWVTFADDGHHALLNTIKTPMYDSTGKLIGVLGVGHDITERKQAEEALRESEALYRNLVFRMPDGVYKSTHEGKFVDVNPAMVKMLGYASKEELLAIDIKRDLYFEPSDRESYTLMEKLEELGIFPLKKKDGSQIWIEDHGWYNLDDKGNIIFHEGIMRDVTERKRAQDEIVLLNSELENRVQQRTLQLENANKELEAFSYSVSHDLRAPLRGIDGWSLALLEDYNHLLDDQGRKYLGRVRSESQRMGNLIDDLLKLSRVNRIDMKKMEVDISDIAQTIANRLSESHAARRCEFIIEPGLHGKGDPQMLEIALTNLLDNAFKFTGTKELAKIEFGKLQLNDGPTYFVRDNGVGFDMEYAKKLFGAFQRMHKQSDFPGTGIGLATVKRIISRHGGRIWAESKPGEGATFYFTVC